jgi:transcriptional repressor of cell division inhibition gene dicB
MTLNQALKHFGSYAQIAAALGIKAPSVYGWEDGGIPELRQLQLQHLTGGALKADAGILPDAAPSSDHAAA